MANDTTVVLPPIPPVGKLDTISHIRKEMVKVYRAARKGSMKTEDMTKFIFALRCIAQTIQESDVEERLATIEQRLLEDHGHEHSHPAYQN